MSVLLGCAGCHAYDETKLDSAQMRRADAGKGPRHTEADHDAQIEAGAGRDTGVDGEMPSVDAGDDDSGAPAAGSGGGPEAGSGGAGGSSAGTGAAGVAGSQAGEGAGAGGSSGPAPAPCTDANGRNWNVNGHCYFPLTVANSWYVSRDRCRELGAQLVSITSAEEQSFVTTVVGASPRWTGLSRFGAPAFSWIGGEGVTYENWEPGSPNVTGEAAAVIRNETYLWFDAAVSQNYAALCERQ
ncbi:MAG TPA: C-type lectin domain-containing protein [Polyangiales bacterium]|nr:C-type lectin domain-containing protein [Polyangiales bacterium]